jgi:hypothetical protein
MPLRRLFPGQLPVRKTDPFEALAPLIETLPEGIKGSSGPLRPRLARCRRYRHRRRRTLETAQLLLLRPIPLSDWHLARPHATDRMQRTL